MLTGLAGLTGFRVSDEQGLGFRESRGFLGLIVYTVFRFSRLGLGFGS